MSLAQQINIYWRQAEALGRTVRNFSPNKRFINLNLVIGVLLVVAIVQHLVSREASPSSEPLVILKGETYHSAYDLLLKKYRADMLRDLPFGDRCDEFFTTMSAAKDDWKFDNFETDGYDDNYVDFNDFLDYMRIKNPDTKFDEKKLIELEKEFQEKSRDAVGVDKRINDEIATLRVFGKCYLEHPLAGSSKFGFSSNIFNDNDESSRRQATPELCSGLEARIFPWISGQLPVYTRWDGTISSGLPRLEELSTDGYDEYKDTKGGNVKRSSDEPNCFLTDFKKNMNGRGYVISASNGQVDELMKLALVLRANGNMLPIQIIHKGDLSKENMNKLIKQFRDPLTGAAMPSSFKKLELSTPLAFPPQEVWFVNCSPAIREGFSHYFQKYANKLLAYMFNSFDDMLLIDTDTVPFVGLHKIFDFPEYVTNGAYFFRDRELDGQNTENAVNYFLRLMPSKLDHHIFDIPLVTDFTLKNRFIGGRYNHYMESGVVAIKRSTHFTGMLMATQLNFWSTTMSKVHGDKELFWLGQSLAGNERYSFNSLAAASIGELTPSESRRFPNSAAQELCSNHPGHVSGQDKNTLLWINSGITFCKFANAAEFDYGKGLFQNFDRSTLEKYYKSKTVIRAAIVPPPQNIVGKNDAGNPDFGWSDEHRFCMSYTWCAAEFVGETGELPSQKGTLVVFDETQTRWFDFIGDVWMDELKPTQ